MVRTDPVVRAPSSSGLADVLDILLDKGLVIDAFVRVSLVGIELLTIDARIVVASVDTYLRFAEAVDRLNLRAQSEAMGIDDIVGPGKSLMGPGGDEEEEEAAAGTGG
jgi:gas vesicle structural protein